MLRMSTEQRFDDISSVPMMMNAVHGAASAAVVDENENDTEGCLLEFAVGAGTTMAPAAARAAWHRSDNARVSDYCIAAPLLHAHVAAEIAVVDVVVKEHGASSAKAPPPASSEEQRADADDAELQLRLNGQQHQEHALLIRKTDE